MTTFSIQIPTEILRILWILKVISILDNRTSSFFDFFERICSDSCLTDTESVTEHFHTSGLCITQYLAIARVRHVYCWCNIPPVVWLVDMWAIDYKVFDAHQPTRPEAFSSVVHHPTRPEVRNFVAWYSCGKPRPGKRLLMSRVRILQRYRYVSVLNMW